MNACASDVLHAQKGGGACSSTGGGACSFTMHRFANVAYCSSAQY